MRIAKTSGWKILADVVVFMVLVVAGAVLYSNTLIEWWVPGFIALAGAMVAWLLMARVWPRLFPAASVPVRLLLHFLYFVPAFFFLLLGANRIGANSESAREERVEVTRKFKEKRYHTRRLSRNRAVRGEPYYTYHTTVVFPDGRSKTLQIGADDYGRISLTSGLTLTVNEGLWGWAIMELPKRQ